MYLTIINPRDFLHDRRRVEITTDIHSGTESVQEPIDSNDNSVHTRDGDINGAGNHDNQDKRGTWDGGCTNGGEGREEDDDDVVDCAKNDSLCGGEESYDDGEVDCCSKWSLV